MAGCPISGRMVLLAGLAYWSMSKIGILFQLQFFLQIISSVLHGLLLLFLYYYFATFIIIIFIYIAQYPNMLSSLYNKIESYLLCIKTNIFINHNKYNCKIYFQIKKMWKR